MKQVKIFFIVTLSLIFTAINLYAQTGIISGRVIDTKTKEPLIGTNIVVISTQRGASSDFDGNYTIENVPVGTYSLRFDYIGYETVFKTDIVVKVSRPAFVNAELKPSVVEGKEVTITAGYFLDEEKTQPSTLGLSREEIRRFPGGFEDIVRTVSTLPGVAINMAGGRNDLLVRGGGPSENLYIINNIEVPNINHFGTQGTSGGSLSFVNLDFVEDVTFSTGGFGAQYGDRMSSVLSLSMLRKRPDTFESKWTISATQYGLDFEIPVRDKGNFIFSARKSYLDLIFKAAGLPFVPVYTDFNVILNMDLSPNDQLFLLGLSAINNVDRDQSTVQNRVTNASLLDNSQYRGISGLNYRRLLKNGYLDLILNVNLSRYRFNQIDEYEKEYFKSEADEWEYVFKVQHYWVISKALGLRSGISSKTITNNNATTFADTIYDRSGNRIPFSQIGVDQNITVNSSFQKYGTFLEWDWIAHPRFEINAGLRGDHYTFLNNSFYLAPRVSLKYKIDDKVSLRTSGGIYYQPPSYVWLTNPHNKNLRALQNRMGILGWDFLLRNDLRFSVEGYYKNYKDLPTGTIPGITDYIIVTNTGAGFGGREDDFQSFGYYDLVSEGTGNAYGFEILFQKKFSRIPLYGIFSFSYNKGEYRAFNGQTYPGQYDQRMILNISGGYIFNDKWEVSGKFRAFSGIPYTPVYRPSDNPLNPGTVQNVPEEYLSSRLDPGHHLDLRVDRYFNFYKWTLIVYLDIQNVYNFKIPMKPQYDFWEDKITDTSDIGILPSIGISLEL